MGHVFYVVTKSLKFALWIGQIKMFNPDSEFNWILCVCSVNLCVHLCHLHLYFILHSTFFNVIPKINLA